MTVSSKPLDHETLHVARESRGLSQRELAELSGTAQSSISKAESGAIVPSGDLVTAWSTALKYPAELLTRQVRPILTTFWRKRVTTSVRVTKMTEASLRLRAHHLEVLTRSAEPPESDVMQCPDAKPEEAAQQVRAQWRMPRGPVENVTELLEDHGVVVLPHHFESPKAMGCSFCHRDLPPTIFFNEDMPTDNVRFSMAHELGHLVMHHLTHRPEADVETEANVFASEFLMPRLDIRSEFPLRLRLEDLAHLKLRWRCSMQSLLMRAKAVGRIDERSSTALWRELSMRGMRRNEGVNLEPETPSLYEELVETHIKELGYSRDSLARAVGLHEAEFLEMYAPSLKPRGLRVVTD